MCARLFGPGAVRRVAQIQHPLLAGELAFAALLVREREIEMDVGVRRHRSRRAPQMVDGLVDLALLFEDTAQVVARDPVQWIELHGREKLGARASGIAHLIERHAKVDVRVDPIRREIEYAAVVVDGFGHVSGEVRNRAPIGRVLRAWGSASRAASRVAAAYQTGKPIAA